MISSFELKSGRTEQSPSQKIGAARLNIFVGPNNSGKSKVLSEIEEYCRHGQNLHDTVILDNIEFSTRSEDEALQLIESIKQAPKLGEKLHDGHISIGKNQQHLHLDNLLKAVKSPDDKQKKSDFCQLFLTHKTLKIDGLKRINLVAQQTAGNLHLPAKSSFQVLMKNTFLRSEVRRILFDAFGSYFVIDPTDIGQLKIRFSNCEPENEEEELALSPKAVAFHAKAKKVDYFSDGYKAFIGIITEMIAGDPNILIIDEPEAFLHPPFASKLGYQLSKLAQAGEKTVFVSTHSPAFIMGCIHSGVPINIIRLTYKDGSATSRVLPNDELRTLMRDPLCRSTGLLSGLFYECVVVTEADADRAFYQEINERLIEFKPEWGISNCLFINAQNKQTVDKIINPLRKLGIPAVAILDIDILKNGGEEWRRLLASASVTDTTIDSLNMIRLKILNKFKEIDKEKNQNMKIHGGINLLSTEDKQSANDLLGSLDSYGIFVIPYGEVEYWLKKPEEFVSKTEWLINIFKKMGEDPQLDTYIKPGNDDVWFFISRIKSWLDNPARKGIPA